MKDVYLKAAERIDANLNTFSCIAIYKVVSATDSYAMPVEAKQYSALFSKRKRDTASGFWGDEWAKDDKGCKQCRVLALLFMHWISKDSHA